MADIIKKVNALGLLDQYTIAKSLGQEDEFCKSFGIDIEKGGKAAAIGEIREFGGKKYQKQANGWRPVKKGDQKSEAKTEDFHDTHTPDQAALEEDHKKDDSKYKDWDSQKHTEQSWQHHGNMIRAQKDKKDSVASWEKNEMNRHVDLASKKAKNETEKISISTSYGDAKFSSKDIATNPSGKLTKPENYSVVAMKDGSFVRTTNNRASKFEKQGDGKIIGKFDPNQQFSERGDEKKPELDFGAKKLMSLISGFSNKYSDITKVSVYGTDKGNWAVLYDGKEIGTIGGNQLSDETVQKYNLEEIDVDEKESTKESSTTVHIGDMSKEQKFAAAAKFGIANPEKLSSKELDKQLTDKNIEAELKKFKESKGSDKEQIQVKLDKELKWINKYRKYIDNGTWPKNEFNDEDEFNEDVRRTEDTIEKLQQKLK